MKVVIVLILTTILNLSAVELKLNDIIFKNSKNEFYSSKDNGSNFKKLRFVENMFKNQIFRSTDDKIFLSIDKGSNWKEDNAPKLSIESNEKFDISIYPNPSSQFIYISSKKNLLDIEIFNILGSPVMKLASLDSKLERVNTESLNSGSYSIRIRTEEGVSFQKILISK